MRCLGAGATFLAWERVRRCLACGVLERVECCLVCDLCVRAGKGGGGAGSEQVASSCQLTSASLTVEAVPVRQIPVLWLAGRRVLASGEGTSGYKSTLLAALASLWGWLVVMGAQPHKEERFMFVVYPLIALAAAAVLREGMVLCDKLRIKVRV